jgi:hypothetical protein
MMHLVVRLGSWSSLRKSSSPPYPGPLADGTLFSALGGESAVEEEYVYEPVGARRKPSKVPPPLYRRPEL